MIPILSVRCDEPKGAVERHVFPLELTRENLDIFWAKARVYPTLFSAEIKEDFSKFLNVFLADDGYGKLSSRGLLWKVDDFVGVFYLTDIIPENDALAHFTFFDGRLRGRDEIVRDMIKYIFNRYKFRRLSAQVPLFAVPATQFFTEKIVGFKREGRKRQSSSYNGTWFDTMHYGLLAEEVAKWD